jgi:hypothetical protein
LTCSAAEAASLAATEVVSARPHPARSSVAATAIIEFFMVILRIQIP